MNIAICDDEKNVRLYLRKLIEKHDGDFEIKEYDSGKEFVSEIKDNNRIGFDIVFLDIAMDDTNGMEAAEILRQVQSENGVSAWGSLPLIIFVTGLKDYMYEAFSVSAFRYILKPVDEAEFDKVFTDAKEEVLRLYDKNEKTNKKIYVGNGMDIRVVKAGDVVYIESIGHKNLIHCNNIELEYYGNLTDLEGELSPVFFRVHRGYLVNLGRIDHYDKQDVFMDNGDIVPVSRYKYTDFVKAYLEYIRQ